MLFFSDAKIDIVIGFSGVKKYSKKENRKNKSKKIFELFSGISFDIFPFREEYFDRRDKEKWYEEIYLYGLKIPNTIFYNKSASESRKEMRENKRNREENKKKSVHRTGEKIKYTLKYILFYMKILGKM
jgi:hypothetical protein